MKGGYLWPLDSLIKFNSSNVKTALQCAQSKLQSMPFTSTQPLHSTILRSTSLHSTPLHSTPLHSTPLHSTPLHSTPLHSTPLYSPILHSTSLHSTPFLSTPLQFTPLHSVLLHSTPLHSTSLHSTPPHSTPLHSTQLHSFSLHSNSLLCTPLHSISLNSTPRNSILLHSSPHQSTPLTFTLLYIYITLYYFDIVILNNCSTSEGTKQGRVWECWGESSTTRRRLHVGNTERHVSRRVRHNRHNSLLDHRLPSQLPAVPRGDSKTDWWRCRLWQTSR